METGNGSGRERGGSVEPADRAAVAKARAQAPKARGEHYELRDPLAEVTYRAPTMKEILAQADRLQASRIVAIGADGSRTPIHKIGDRWERQPTLRPHPPAPEQAVDDEPGAKRQTKATEPARTQAEPARDEAEALRAARTAEIDAALQERYVLKRSLVRVNDVPMGRTEYRFRGDTQRVAFTETAFKLSTDVDNPSVARSMVDVAEARGWKALRITGTEDFRRQVWLEATVRGVKALGYEPSPAELQLVEKERESRRHNRIEPVRDAAAAEQPAGDIAKAKGATGRGGSGRKAVLAALEALLVDRKVPAQQRAAVMAAAEQNLAQRVRNGETHRVKVYDRQAPSHRETQKPTRDPSRVPAVERAFPQPTR